MVQAWLHDDNNAVDSRELHQTNPIKAISIAYLEALGVSYWKLPTAGAIENPNGGKLGEIRTARNYSSHDVVTISREKLPNYDEKLKIFYSEHIHEDEEIRFVIEGSGFFDIRNDANTHNEWIRIFVEAGDMIVLPAGMYHRFTLDTKNYIQVIRLFKENPKW
jgi:1,2-dihydroxy-3-keto-5-methylthiopentene dioxygenase